MRERTLSTGAVVLVALLVAAPMTAAVGGGRPAAAAEGADVAPGARVAGVVGVQRAELEGDLAELTLAVQLRRSQSPNATAAVVAERAAAIRDRIDRLEDRLQELRAARTAGNLSRSEFRARTAELVAEVRTLRRLANETAAVAKGLPAAALRAQGVNVSAVRALPDRAAALAGPKVAEIARSIAGPGVGTRVGRGPPPGVPGANVTPGPPGGDDGPPGQGGPPNDAGPPDDPGRSGNETTTTHGSGSESVTGVRPTLRRSTEAMPGLAVHERRRT